jgi:hypothetical protein
VEEYDEKLARLKTESSKPIWVSFDERKEGKYADGSIYVSKGGSVPVSVKALTA